MDQAADLRLDTHWRTAVMALRGGYVALVVVAIGLIVALTGSTPWVLVVGVVIWLVAAVITAAEFMRGRSDLPEPRPDFWAIRSMLLRDSINLRAPRTH